MQTPKPTPKQWETPTILTVRPANTAQSGALALVEGLNVLGNLSS